MQVIYYIPILFTVAVCGIWEHLVLITVDKLTGHQTNTIWDGGYISWTTEPRECVVAQKLS